MEVKADSVKVFCNTLSGGNKQKVVLAKWLGKGSDIMILDCPTRGIDVGTKAAIYQLIMQMKEEGKSILLISEELQELIGMSDRIVLLRDGAVSGEFLRNEGLTEAKLIPVSYTHLSFIIFAARGAQEPFSMMPTVRFWKLCSVRRVI